MGDVTLRIADGARLWGHVEGSGPPIGFCHGGPGLWDYFDRLAESLAGSFIVHRWDQRGCGRSAPSDPYGLDRAVQDVQEVKAAFNVAEPWVLLGHSWGAYLALLSTLQNPESTCALIYVAGTGPPTWWSEVGSSTYRAERAARLSDHDQDRLDELTRNDRTSDEEIEFRRLSWVTDVVQSDPLPKALEEMVSAPMAINWTINRYLSDVQLHADEELLDLSAACDVPSLFIHGDQDPRPLHGAKMISDRIPHSRFVTVKDAAHLPWVEQPSRTAEIISAFLDEVRA